ncbi:MAG: methyltransferase domain-containing protein, partial [Anaerolineales bacterium]|nr:methyltransferase domain-containing protein [Anaerolineales bacterium]
MKPEIARQLRDLNRQFYNTLADPFAESRGTPQPGFARLLDWLPAGAGSLLDVGCGNGRFGHYLFAQQKISSYTGVDFSVDLLQKARELVPHGRFQQVDMSQPNFLQGLEQFDVVACLAAMQHVPGHINRVT